jgi:hypothetical protein
MASAASNFKNSAHIVVANRLMTNVACAQIIAALLGVAYPEKEVSWLTKACGAILPTTCELVAAFAASFVSGDETCHSLQMVSSYCGCPALQDSCMFYDGEPLQEEFYDKEIPLLSSERRVRYRWNARDILGNSRPTFEQFKGLQEA